MGLSAGSSEQVWRHKNDNSGPLPFHKSTKKAYGFVFNTSLHVAAVLSDTLISLVVCELPALVCKDNNPPFPPLVSIATFISSIT